MPSNPIPAAAPERRYLTMAFSDLVDYTRLSEQVDPEELHLIQQKYQQIALEIVERYGGFVASFSGDGILIYFGYPVAHENDAERAVRASLELVKAVQELDLATPSQPSLRLKVRIGLHTGQVLLAAEQASGGMLEHAAIGQAVNLASRLQELAPPNCVLVSRDTLELVEGLFESKPLGIRNLKGISQPIMVHEILRQRSNTQRNSARFRRGATRMIGRTGVIDMMRRCWNEVQADRKRRCFVVTGEAGLGKSRLAMELDREVERQSGNSLRINCHELFSGTPLYAVAAALWANAGVETGDDEASRAAKLSNLLKRFDLLDPRHLETACSLIETLGTPGRRTPASVPVGIKKRQFDLVLALLRAIADRGPLMVWVEDAHWIDPSSTELLNDLSARLADAPILFLITARKLPERVVLPDAHQLVQLAPLSEQECLELARSVPGGEALSKAVLERAVRLADGNPLFVEQLTLSLIDNEGRPRTAGDSREFLPLTLAEMMSERLDRLPGGRRVVQAAACLGRSFTSNFVDLLIGPDQERDAATLEKLVQADILRVQQDSAEERYEFRHALLQRAAYDSLIQPERKAMHARIARALSAGESGPVIPEVLAHHLTAAGQTREAIGAWLQAGMAASRRSAYVEAIAHIERGLELLAQIPDQNVREALEIGLQAALIGPFTAIAGPTSEKMLRCCQRGLQLCKDGPPSPLIFAFLFGQFSHAVCRGNGTLAMTSAELFQSTAKGARYESGQVIGHRLLGLVHLGQGNVSKAVDELGASLQLYSAERDEAATHVFGQNTQVHSRSLLSLSLLHAGRIEEALNAGTEALLSIDELKHPHSSALALGYVGGWVFGLCGASEQQMHAARRLVTLAEEHHLQSFRIFGQAFIGWALCRFGDLRQGIPILEKAVGDLEAVEFWLSLPGHMAVLADAMRLAGRHADAASLCDRGLQHIAQAGERLHEPELMRVRAMVAHDMRGKIDDHVHETLHAAVTSARTLSLPVCEHRALRTLHAYLGASRLDAAAAARLDELSYLDGWEERAAHVVRAAYRAASGLP
jgi:class 3 adenylate cyclase/tetratricopeptide (TPR) repeat protein